MTGLPKPDMSPLPPPGVTIIDEGSAGLRGGGVDGGWIRALMAGFAGDGDVARYRSRSAPSSDLPLFFLLLL